MKTIKKVLVNQLIGIKSKLLGISEEPRKVAMGYALGIFLAASPFIGLKIFIAIAITFIFKWMLGQCNSISHFFFKNVVWYFFLLESIIFCFIDFSMHFFLISLHSFFPYKYDKFIHSLCSSKQYSLVILVSPIIVGELIGTLTSIKLTWANSAGLLLLSIKLIRPFDFSLKISKV